MKLKLILCVVSIAIHIQCSSCINLEDVCNDGYKRIGTIKSMNEFIQLFKNELEKNPKVPSKAEYQNCYLDKEAITVLEPILAEKDDLCHPKHINEMIKYHELYLKSSVSAKIKTTLHMEKKRPLTRFFFRRYALSVSKMCRKNMIENIKEANTFFEKDLYTLAPWLKVTNSFDQNETVDEIEKNISSDKELQDDDDESEKFDADADADEDTENEIEHSELDEIITNEPVLSNFENALKYVLKKVDTVEKLITVAPLWEKEKSPKRKIKIVREYEYEQMKDLQDKCSSFSVFYETAILSVVRLDEAGYSWNVDTNVQGDEEGEKNKMLHNWLGITQVCHSVLSYDMRLRKSKQVIRIDPIKFAEENAHKFDRNRLEEEKELASVLEIKNDATSAAQHWKKRFKKNLRAFMAKKAPFYFMGFSWALVICTVIFIFFGAGAIGRR